MNMLTIIVLGLVQGITEFLPVSSSGHVLLLSRLLDEPSSFEFDVLVSFGTLFAIVVYYRIRLKDIGQNIVLRRDFDLLFKLILATIPAVIVGYFGQNLIKNELHSTLVVTVMLALIGVLMIISRRWLPHPELPVNKDVKNIKPIHALLVGISQCFSLISGSSRSGVTILAALKLGFDKEKAAEWSFLIGIPIIFGASMKVLLSQEGQKFVTEQPAAFILANLASFVSGIIAIHILLKILKRYGLYWFGWYRIGLAIVLLILLSVKIIT